MAIDEMKVRELITKHNKLMVEAVNRAEKAHSYGDAQLEANNYALAEEHRRLVEYYTNMLEG